MSCTTCQHSFLYIVLSPGLSLLPIRMENWADVENLFSNTGPKFSTQSVTKELWSSFTRQRPCSTQEANVKVSSYDSGHLVAHGCLVKKGYNFKLDDPSRGRGNHQFRSCTTMWPTSIICKFVLENFFSLFFFLYWNIRQIENLEWVRLLHNTEGVGADSRRAAELQKSQTTLPLLHWRSCFLAISLIPTENMDSVNFINCSSQSHLSSSKVRISGDWL